MSLIDRGQVMNNYLENLGRKDSYKAKYEALVMAVDYATTIDVEPVVRCKDCKHYSCGTCEQIEYIMDGYYRGTFEVKRPDDFCSCGERMVKHD